MPRLRRHIAGDTAQGGGATTFFCPLGGMFSRRHGLLRFRTNDVLLGTSGVDVCVSVVSSSSGILNRFPELRPPFNPSVSCWKPSRWREVPSSKSGRPLYLLLTPERAQFRAQMLLRIRNRVLTLSACGLVCVRFSSRDEEVVAMALDLCERWRAEQERCRRVHAAQRLSRDPGPSRTRSRSRSPNSCRSSVSGCDEG